MAIRIGNRMNAADKTLADHPEDSTFASETRPKRSRLERSGINMRLTQASNGALGYAWHI